MYPLKGQKIVETIVVVGGEAAIATDITFQSIVNEGNFNFKLFLLTFFFAFCILFTYITNVTPK